LQKLKWQLEQQQIIIQQTSNTLQQLHHQLTEQAIQLGYWGEWGQRNELYNKVLIYRRSSRENEQQLVHEQQLNQQQQQANKQQQQRITEQEAWMTVQWKGNIEKERETAEQREKIVKQETIIVKQETIILQQGERITTQDSEITTLNALTNNIKELIPLLSKQHRYAICNQIIKGIPEAKVMEALRLQHITVQKITKTKQTI
jgi:maltodextrin utilization protein YvdJ